MKELALNIMDIAQNSIRAKADHIVIAVKESVTDDSLIITITDNGMGIPKNMLKNVTDPFVTSRTKRKVGMGLAFLSQHAELAGGKLTISSKEYGGTCVKAIFSLNHIDRQPLGDIAGVIKLIVMANPKIEIEYFHKTDIGEFSVKTSEIRQVFEVKELNDNVLMEDIRKMIRGNLMEIGTVA